MTNFSTFQATVKAPEAMSTNTLRSDLTRIFFSICNSSLSQ